ncbi:hypothetical protein [Flammeovirga pacifica]|uniref:Alpha-L-arabinofuranosidase 1 catalytic domain-containing protein n=1 Tax=Flammeovirga pacifica TaxID=915059 RepID=A0A1S1Z125_FLAPC|nr:hypothetical protein [Flammeovirga pacifica]OHX66942.1 hypothetical protein NH26_11595 [Flammeovirga pacifica]
MKVNFNILVAIGITFFGCAKNSEPKADFKITNQVTSSLEDDLFGQFLERPSWDGESGPEAAIKKGTHQLQEGVVDLMAEMHIPVLRFPGGTDVDFTEWTDLIDLPNRASRPILTGNRNTQVGSNFGYDEAGALSDTLGSSLMLVVNFGDAYYKRKPLEETVMHEMGMIAYMSSTLDEKLPEELSKWPQLRARNGHTSPYKVKYIQIANEPWVLDKKNIHLTDSMSQETLDNYFLCLDAFVDKINAIFPNMEIIVDANCMSISPLIKPRYGNKVDYVALHQYKPWGVGAFKKGESFVKRDSLSNEEIWNAWIAMPEINEQGVTYLGDAQVKNTYKAGYPIAVTEWNWNGWWKVKSAKNKDVVGSNLAKSFGAAGYLHAMMRDADKIKIGIQSMLVGQSWGITAIRVSEEEEFSPYSLPSGQITGLYAEHHGDKMLKVDQNKVAKYHQPYKVNSIASADSVAVLDVVSSVDDEYLYIHVINRSFNKPIKTSFDVSDWNPKNTDINVYSVSGEFLNSEKCNPSHFACSTIKIEKSNSGRIAISFKERSVNILKVPLK